MNRRRPRVIRDKGVIAAARIQRAPTPGARLPFQTDPLTRRVMRPFLIAALATAPAIGMLVVVDIITPAEPWLALGWVCFLAALEGAYTAIWLHNPDSRGVDRGTYRAAEVLLLIVAARIVSWVLFDGSLPTPDEVRVYLAAPLSFLMVANFFTTAFVILVAWYLAVTIGRIFAQLDIGVEEIQFYTLSPGEQKAQADNRPIATSRGELQEQYLRLWLAAGVLMVLLAALSTFEVGAFATEAEFSNIARLGLRPVMLFTLLLYFLSGLWLLSHARLLRMNAQWLADGVGKEAGLERSWQRSALTVLVAIALIAAFLPIGSTLGISQILRVLLNGLFYIAGLLFAAIGFLFAAVISVFTRNAEPVPPATPQPLPTLPPPPVTTPPPANPAVAFILSSAFWAILVALVIGALLFFLRERGYRLERARVRDTWNALWAQVVALWRRVRRRTKAARLALRQRLRGPATLTTVPAVTGRGMRRPRGTTPREQIRYYYLSTIRRAEQRGLPRPDSATPLEFVRDLKEEWPDAESDLDSLTDAFVEARYSQQPIDQSAVGRVKTEWKRVRERLRRGAARQ